MRSSYSSSRLLWGFVFVALFMVFGGTATAQVRYDSAAYKVLVDTDSLDTIPVGTNITLQNWQKYKHFMPIAMQVLFGGQYRYKIGPEPFYTMAVGPHSSFPLPKKYRDDTEKYKDQTKLVQVSSGGYTVDGYIAGMPFPDPTEPNAAEKMAYNGRFRYNPFVQHYFDVAYNVDRFGSIFRQEIDVTQWRLSGISEVGMPVDQPYADGYLLTARYYVLAPEQVRYTTQVAMVSKDPAKAQEIYVFLPSLRRSLRLSSSARCSPILGGDFVQDDNVQDAYLQWPNFKITYLGTKKVLWMVNADPVQRGDNNNFVIVGGVPGWPKNVVGKWELRDAWVIDLTPLPVMGSYCYGHKVIYIDRETLQELNVDIYDVNNKFWKMSYSIYGPLKVNANERSLVGGVNQQTMIDFQNQHASESLPPSPGASINDDVPQDYHNAEVLGFPGGLTQIMK
ncbi:MAG: DUF1329 domain-containing protein [Candidatus Binataceae bacterium]